MCNKQCAICQTTATFLWHCHRTNHHQVHLHLCIQSNRNAETLQTLKTFEKSLISNNNNNNHYYYYYMIWMKVWKVKPEQRHICGAVLCWHPGEVWFYWKVQCEGEESGPIKFSVPVKSKWWKNKSKTGIGINQGHEIHSAEMKTKRCVVTLWFSSTVVPAAPPAWRPAEVYQDPPSPQLCGWTHPGLTLWNRLWEHPVWKERRKGPFTAFSHCHTLTSRVAKRACCCGLSGLTLTVWLDLNSWSFASLSQAWPAPWPVSTQQMRHNDSAERAARTKAALQTKTCCHHYSTDSTWLCLSSYVLQNRFDQALG